MHTGQPVVYIILRQHDLADPCKILRLLISHPEKLRCREACKGYIGRVVRKFVLSDLLIEIIHLFVSSAVIPEDCGADHLVIFVENDEAVHLSTGSDADDLSFVKSFRQLGNSRHRLPNPRIRILFRPAGLWKNQRIFTRDNIQNLSLFIHQKELDGRGTKINSYCKHNNSPKNFLFSMRPYLSFFLDRMSNTTAASSTNPLTTL